MSDSICNSNKVTTGNSSTSQRDDHKASFATPIKPDNPNKMKFRINNDFVKFDKIFFAFDVFN